MLAEFLNCVRMRTESAEFWVEPGELGGQKVLFLGMRDCDSEKVEIALHPGDAIILAEHLKRLAMPARTTIYSEEPEF